MTKSDRIERLRNRSARQACKEDLVDIYCALTGAKGGVSFPGSTDDLRRAIAAHLCASLATNADAPVITITRESYGVFPGDEV